MIFTALTFEGNSWLITYDNIMSTVCLPFSYISQISKKNHVIKKLKSSLHQMEKLSEDFVSRTQQDAEKQSQADVKASEGKQTRLQQEFNQLTVQLNNLIIENKEAESALRKVH